MRIAIGLLMMLFASDIALGKRFYVAEGKKRGDGSSWNKASNNLKSILDTASVNDTIWVAKGIYYPTHTQKRTESFVIKEGVTLLGGFAKGSQKLDDRDVDKYKTVLSGNIGNPNDSTDNSFNILRTFGAIPLKVKDCYIDGFTFEHGQADSSRTSYQQTGGAIYLRGSFMRLHVSNCIFRNNYAVEGGAIFGYIRAFFSQCNFQYNRAQAYGAGNGYRADFDYCLFDQNKASKICGALRTAFSNIRNCRFTSNTAPVRGGALFTGASLIENCHFEGNSTTDTKNAHGGAIYYITSGGPHAVLNSVFLNNKSGGDGGAIYAYNSAWTTKDSVIICGSTFNSNEAAEKGGAIYSWGGSFFMNNCILLNNSSKQEGSALMQYNKYYFTNNIIKNSSFYNNKSDSNSTIYFYNSSATRAPELINCILHQNDTHTLKTPLISTYSRSNIRVKRCIIDFSYPSLDTLRSDPNFIDPKGPDGIVGTLDDHLQVSLSSKAINGGIDSNIYGNCTSFSDIIGNPRVAEDTIDIGAYEKVDCKKITKPSITTLNSVHCIGDTLVLIDRIKNDALTQWKVNGISLTQAEKYHDTLRIPLKTPGNLSVERIATLCDSMLVAQVQIQIKDLTKSPTITSITPTPWCDGDTVTLSTNKKYDRYQWSTGDTTRTIKITKSVQVQLQVANTGKCFGEEDTAMFTFNTKPQKPSIQWNKRSACHGDSVELWLDPTSTQYEWSNGDNAKTIYLDRSLSIAVRVTNGNGCVSPWSDAVTVTIRDSLATPTQVYDALWACEGESVTLKTDKKYHQVRWNSGSFKDSVVIGQTGNFWYYYQDTNGCHSNTTDTIRVEIRKDPVPKVNSTGTSFCEGDSLKLTVANLYPTYLWSNGDTAQTVWIKEPTNLSVTVYDGFCEGHLEQPIQVEMRPTPVVEVEVDGNDSFCLGERTYLKSKELFPEYEWSNGEKTRQLSLTTSGRFRLRVTNGFQCQSQWSNWQSIVALPLPRRPTLKVEGALHLCKGDSSVLIAPDGYEMYSWNGTIGGKDQIVVSAPGDWQLTVIDTHGCESPPSLPINIKQTIVPVPKYGQTGDLKLCQGEELRIRINTSYENYDWHGDGNGPSVTIRRADTLTFTGVTNGCRSDTLQWMVEIHKTPTTPSIQVDTSFAQACETEYKLSTSIEASDYEWQPKNGNNASLSISESGTYQVRYQDGNDCWSPWSKAVEIAPIPFNNLESASLSLFPNPVNDVIVLQSSNTVFSTQEAQFVIMDLAGNIVTTYSIDPISCGKLRQSFEVGQMRSGVYIAKLITDNFEEIFRFVIIR